MSCGVGRVTSTILATGPAPDGQVTGIGKVRATIVLDAKASIGKRRLQAMNVLSKRLVFPKTF